MNRITIGQIYLYLVCFVCVFIILFSVIKGLLGIISVTWPELTISKYEWQKVASFENYKDEHKRMEGLKTVNEEKLKIRYQEERKNLISEERRGGKLAIINTVITLLVTLPVFTIHWKLARRETIV